MFSVFLSAVADRLGLWGAAGAPGVVWGNFSSFLEYTAVLNPWIPKAMLWPLGAVVTVLEVALAALLLAGFQLQKAALGSAVLLGLFGIAMALTVGLKAPLDYGVFTAAAAALALTVLTQTCPAKNWSAPEKTKRVPTRDA